MWRVRAAGGVLGGLIVQKGPYTSYDFLQGTYVLQKPNKWHLRFAWAYLVLLEWEPWCKAARRCHPRSVKCSP